MTLTVDFDFDINYLNFSVHLRFQNSLTMKKIFTLLLITFGMLATNAQSTISIPNNSFENWQNHQGYNVSVLFISLPIYSSFSSPTDWNYLSYPVNETVSFSGFNLNVNTNLPLLKVSTQTSDVPNGSKALKMQSFMLSDVISSTAYSLVGSYVDQELMTMVFPTVLSTGQIDLDNFLPLMNSIIDNISDPAQLFNVFSGEDVNQYFSGGLPLNGEVPETLTGYYKYTSATSGDNGGIMMLGTKYNTTVQRREVVGGGFSLAFSDTNSYVPFSINYNSLHQYVPSVPEIDPDTLIIMMFSSANNHRQQGSAFYLDNLVLNAQTDTIPVTPEEPDTCSAILNLTITSVDTMNATLTWNNAELPANWQYAYGPSGLDINTVTTTVLYDSTLTLTGLQPGTQYDCYVRSQCNDTLFSNWCMVTFQTDTLIPVIPEEPDTCSAILNLTVVSIDTMDATLTWNNLELPEYWQYAYGPAGLDINTATTTNLYDSTVTLHGLQPGTQYDCYVRSQCNDTLFSNWSMVTFQTDTLVPHIPDNPDTLGIEELALKDLKVFPNPTRDIVHCIASFPIEHIAVFDVFGRKMMETDEDSINLNGLSNGLYILKINHSIQRKIERR